VSSLALTPVAAVDGWLTVTATNAQDVVAGHGPGPSART
jgi:hypothetical protein